jgi:hypothetical protein
MLLELSIFNPMYQSNTGVIVFSLLSTSLIDFHPQFCQTSLPMKPCCTKFPIILILGVLAAFVMLQLLAVIGLSLTLDLEHVSLLVIPLVLKDINFLTLTVISLLSQEMFFMNTSFHFFHPTIPSPVIPSTNDSFSNQVLPNSFETFPNSSFLHSHIENCPSFTSPHFVQDSLPFVPDQSPSPASSPISLENTCPLRKSTRTSRPPTYLQDYHCQLALSTSPITSSCASTAPITSVMPHSLTSTLSYQNLSHSHRQYALAITTL